MAKQNLRLKKIKTGMKPRVVRGVKPAQSKTKRNSAESISSWHDEISALQSKVFPSLDHALEALTKGVVSKLGVSGRGAAKEREFVRLLLETDPELLHALERAVRIK